MKTASFVGVILPQTPVHLAQILNSIFEWGDFNQGTFTFNPNSLKISNWTTNVANQSNNNLNWRVLSQKHIRRKLRVFGVKFWTQIVVCVKKLTFRNSVWKVINSNLFSFVYSGIVVISVPCNLNLGITSCTSASSRKPQIFPLDIPCTSVQNDDHSDVDLIMDFNCVR